ncbi:TonB-dependent SusC/RagA subfamily outer membrane receptor [Saonia flava]|uniref:TonB-dependent SusC/RagA subfamily outer membrane receptor n=1 Tax=Saonia flava TaxID=523696 RepID=A0A846QP89_9FLAO|nr:TonB-dependent receptor plug domain-containing protein [Saonia flava]NJB69881.1 TonB-dependent SusC/RagA subfamily outer membrane receptor [Saonia flava]
MKRNLLNMALLGTFVLMGCKANKTQSEVVHEDLPTGNYNVELANKNDQIVDEGIAIKNLTDYLRGIPGVRVQGDGANANIVIRGSNSLNLSEEPTYIVDGRQYHGSYTSLFYSLPGEVIKSVTVLKDASSLGMYGSSAANGVIEIVTKN